MANTPFRYKGRFVGYITTNHDGHQVYVTKRSSQNFHRQTLGWTISKPILESLERMEVPFIKIVYQSQTETIEYVSPIKRFFEKGVLSKDNYGEDQLGLLEQDFLVWRNKAHDLVQPQAKERSELIKENIKKAHRKISEAQEIYEDLLKYSEAAQGS